MNLGARRSSTNPIVLKATKGGLYLPLKPKIGHASYVFYVRVALPAFPTDQTTLQNEPLFFDIAFHNAVGVARDLARGADPNASQPSSLLLDHVSLTPLYLVARMRDLALLKTLLDGSADPNARSGPQRMTPLMEAANRHSLECAELLLRKGVNTRLRSKRGLAAIDYARRRKDIKMVDMLAR